MNYIKKNSDFEYIIHLIVKPNSKFQKVVKDKDMLTFFLKSKPIRNKANIELINFIKNKLDLSSSQIQIIHGSKIRDKSIKITFQEKIDQSELLEELLS
ncbi:MAG: DUF167 domain-containing protein [Candidatus Thorarchaeota archaeon]